MRIRAIPFLMAVAAAALGIGPQAHAESTFHFAANQVYRGLGHSPFAGSGLRVENFEDGLVNTVGMTIDRGSVRGPKASTDSIDRDDGQNDGWGRQGRSFSSGIHKSINIRFNSASGNMPQMAGLVWTDGRKNSIVVVKAWDKNGNYLGSKRVRLGDASRMGGTSDDRFLGVSSQDGISRIEIRSNYAGFEMDHVQFSYSMMAVPVPPAFGIGAAGLAGLGLWQLRRRRRPVVA